VAQPPTGSRPSAEAGTTPRLALTGVTVAFGGVTALSDVSLTVAPRQVQGLIGPNGAGKTTVFNVICGFVQPTEGTVEFEGRPLRPRPDRLVRHGISRTLQAVGLFPHLTSVENVMVGAAGARRAGFGGALLGLPNSDRDERRLRAAALEWLDRLDATGIADLPAAALPYPLQKRVALARALVSRPRLLLLDEPAGGLGAEDIEPLARLIRSLPTDEEASCSVLLVEHHMDLVMSVCDQVLVLDFGRTVASGTPDEVRANPQVATAYLGEDVPADAAADAAGNATGNEATR
jgi:branched-chain amino acid transport system ATP-binding protein